MKRDNNLIAFLTIYERGRVIFFGCVRVFRGHNVCKFCNKRNLDLQKGIWSN